VDKQHGTFASVSAHRVSHCSIVAEESGGPENVAASQEVFEPNAVAETFRLTLAPMVGPLYEGRYEGVGVSGTF
jgi:hypothetical protein